MVIICDNFSFEYENRLGSGGFGTVYYGCFENKPVAVKRISLKLNKENLTESIKLEEEIQKQLKHENLVALYHATTDKAYAYFAMELMEYGDLFEIIATPYLFLDTSAQMRIIKDMLSGLSYMHQHLFLHRDLKAENIVFNARMQAKISDFGFAIKISDAKTKHLSGSFANLAPELAAIALQNIRNKNASRLDYTYSRATDIYALGMTILMMNTRKNPYEVDEGNRNKEKAYFKKIVNGRYEKLPQNTPEILSTIVSGCLRQNPQQRFNDEEIGRLLERDRSVPNPITTIHALNHFINTNNLKAIKILIALNKISLKLPFTMVNIHPIHLAARQGKRDIVKILLEHEPLLVDLKNSKHFTALSLAVYAGHHALVSYLISMGADVNVATMPPRPIDDPQNYNNSPLDWAIVREDKDIGLTLMKAGSKANNYCVECYNTSMAKNTNTFFKKPSGSQHGMTNSSLSPEGIELECYDRQIF